jgi:fructose/tagatose bisphosphate aldolase
MDEFAPIERITKSLGDSIKISDDMKVSIENHSNLRSNMDKLVRMAVFGDANAKSIAQWIIRECARELGVYPASIHDFYLARGRREVRDDFSVPAINLRSLPFYAAKAVFRAAKGIDAKAIIFEIARSEMGYTGQAPAEYASNIFAAAIAESYSGPVFLQGDHFQVSAKRYQADPGSEISTIRKLCRASLRAGFYNIDIDTSTLVDLSKETIPEQQEVNFSLCADFATFIRGIEPDGVDTSLGGEIGEVGGQNSTEPELRAFMDGFQSQFDLTAPGEEGLSKISIQTGTSHGGVVLPDGSIAQVSVDFDTLQKLSAIAKDYGMGGAVQHGASTLPEEAFARFVDANALEVHLATNFQNILYDRIPDELREEIYAYLRDNHDDERKPDQTEEQFYYKTRKRALGPFKAELWNISADHRKKIEAAWEDQFTSLFDRLNVGGTSEEVERFTGRFNVHEPLSSYHVEEQPAEDTSDLAD